MSQFLIILTVFLETGCSSGPDPPEGMPTLHPVKITLLQDGKPVESASVRLVPNGKPSSWYSGGSSDAQGMVAIKTHGQFLGAPAGNYKVTITKIETPTASNSSLENLNQATHQDSSFDLVDPKFGSPAKTPLLIEVAEGSNEKEFELGPPARIKRKGPPG